MSVDRDLAGGGRGDDVVLLDEQGRPTGRAPRATVHGPETPLHLAFSCYLYREDGRLLLTRRALGKRSWPGVWTNAFCGHPRPGEDMAEAVLRRGEQELGVRGTRPRLLLPDFRYRAVDAAGVAENELCPVYAAMLDARAALDPDPGEVAEHRWVDPADLAALVTLAPWTLSPWCVAQVRELVARDLL